MTQQERDLVEFACSLQLADGMLHDLESLVECLREHPAADAKRLEKINGLLGDIFFELGIQIEAAEAAIVME